MAKAGRITAVVTSLLMASVLSGCGFQPLYGGSGFATLPGLEIDAPGDRLGYLVEDSLRDYLGGGTSPYRITLDTEFNESVIGLSAVGRARRYSADIVVEYTLYGPDGFTHEGEISEPVYYEAPSDAYALIAARAAAEERGAELVAERLVRELAAALRRNEDGLEP